MDIHVLHYNVQPISWFVDETGCVWWPAKGICDVLSLENVSVVMTRLDEDERAKFNLGLSEDMWCVNEFGLYNVILGSRKPEARAFKRWVTHEVLPEIRRTGAYTTKLPPKALPVREHAEVSSHLLAVWRVLREGTEPLTNREIAQQAGVAVRTARAHTQYLLQLGLLDLYETFPRHLYQLAARAEKRQHGYYQRLEQLSHIVAARQAF
jgi:prophage antirepressor-like protein